jgi:nicotinate-nucleotide adenylyltransferase
MGHIAAIRELRQVTELPVIVVPTGTPTYRPSPQASAVARAEMVELAVRTLGDPLVTVCRREVDRVTPTHTVDTVEWLRSKHPDLGLVLALGSDVAAALPSWQSVGRLLGQVRLLVFERAGAPKTGQTVLTVLRQQGLPLVGAEVVSLSTPAVDATGIRAAIAAGVGSPEMLPPLVAEYVSSHRLYRGLPTPGRGTAIG